MEWCHFVYFIYEGIKFVLWYGPYHKNVVDKEKIVAGFVSDQEIDVSLFKLGHEYVCVCWGAFCSHDRAFDLKV